MDELIETLLKLGYKNRDAKILANKLQAQDRKISESILTELFGFLGSLGYSREDIIRMTKKLPAMCQYSIDSLKHKIEGLEELGYNRGDIIKMTKVYPQIYSISMENINKKIQEMGELGYSKEDVMKMGRALPATFGYTVERIRKRIEELEELGYSREDVIHTTKSFPALFGYNIENMKKKIEDIQKLGFSREEVLKMVIDLPQIYGYSMENITQKISFYDSIGLHEFVARSPQTLRQSTKLSYARYMVLRENGIEVTPQTGNRIFNGFPQRIKISKEEMLEKYPYNEETMQIILNESEELDEHDAKHSEDDVSSDEKETENIKEESSLEDMTIEELLQIEEQTDEDISETEAEIERLKVLARVKSKIETAKKRKAELAEYRRNNGNTLQQKEDEGHTR